MMVVLVSLFVCFFFVCFFLFFFFQAEDGIRDIGVTGVQTCALPISLSRRIERLDLRFNVFIREDAKV